MPFITTPQWVGRMEGLQEGIRVTLKVKFGEAGLQLLPEIEHIEELEKLQAVLHALETVDTPEELRKVWTS